MMSNVLLTRQNKEIFIFLSICLNLFVDATQLIHYAKNIHCYGLEIRILC